jgi:hypothetical protein
MAEGLVAIVDSTNWRFSTLAGSGFMEVYETELMIVSIPCLQIQ